MFNDCVGASFLPRGGNRMDVFLHFRGQAIGSGDTLTKAAEVALDKVEDPETRELLIVIMNKCIT